MKMPVGVRLENTVHNDKLRAKVTITARSFPPPSRVHAN